jgi:hypothetical protein
MNTLRNVKVNHLALVLVSIIVFLSSCAKLPIYQCQNIDSEPDVEFEKINTSNYNKSNNVNFGIAINESNFYYKAIFHEQESQEKIMRGGLNLYFDPNGKKGKDFQLKIEKAKPSEMKNESFSQGSMSSRGSGGGGGNMQGMQRSRNMEDLPAMISKVYTQITWIANGVEEVFYRDLYKDKIEVNFVTNEYNELELLVKMPISEIPKTQDGLLSMGMETSSSSSSTNGPGGNMSSGGGMGGGGGGMGGGGMSGGGMSGGGGMGGSGGGMGGPGGSSSSSSGTMKIWFQIEL